MDTEDQAIDILQRAYVLLLQMPHGGVRARQQIVLATLRDAIAAETKNESEQVQNDHESMARYSQKHGLAA